MRKTILDYFDEIQLEVDANDTGDHAAAMGKFCESIGLPTPLLAEVIDFCVGQTKQDAREGVNKERSQKTAYGLAFVVGYLAGRESQP